MVLESATGKYAASVMGPETNQFMKWTQTTRPVKIKQLRNPNYAQHALPFRPTLELSSIFSLKFFM